MSHSTPNRGTVPYLTVVPVRNDERCWHDLAMERARVEGIDLLAAADHVRVLGEYAPCDHPDAPAQAAPSRRILSVTRADLAKAAGSVVPLRRHS